MKYLTLIVAVIALAVFVAPVMAADASYPISPGPVGPGNSNPDVYLAARFFDIGIDVDGSGSSINPGDIRPGFYAFTGEKIIYYVLVRDLNGVQDIDLVYWVHNGSEMGPCDPVTVQNPGGEDPYFCVLGHTSCSGFFSVEIDEATNLDYDSQTDEIYRCELTVESNWMGSLIYVEAEDTSGNKGQTLAENWNFNPPLSVDLTTSNGASLAFDVPVLDQEVEGATSPNCEMVPNGGEDLTYRNCMNYLNLPEADKLCDVSFSTNSLILKNTGVANLWPFIAAENFYDSTGMAKCPSSNELSANQFEYRALAGTYDSGWRMMPQYSPNLGCAGINLGDSDGGGFFDLIFGQCRGGCRIPTGTTFPVAGMDILAPGQTVDVRLKIVWPTPCIGTFDDGSIYMIVRAV